MMLGHGKSMANVQPGAPTAAKIASKAAFGARNSCAGSGADHSKVAPA
jgi:hypothetical protein